MKNLFGNLILFAFLAMPVALLLNPVLNQDVEHEFIGLQSAFVGQETGEVGELVRFLAEGQIVRWECLPKSVDHESYGENNENFVISFRKPGIYTIVAAIYIDGDLNIHTQSVTIEGPKRPDPIVPDTVTVVTDDTIFTPLVKRVEVWCQKYEVDNQTCQSLSRNFYEVVSGIESGELITPGQIISETAKLNTDLEVPGGLMAELQAYLTSQSDAGLLKTPKDHVIVWNSIAKGMSNAAAQ